MAELVERVSALFEADKPALRAVEGPLHRVRVDGEGSVTQAQNLTERAVSMLATAVAVFHLDHLARLQHLCERLVHYAMVYYGADLAWQNAVPDSTPKVERKRLTGLARLWDGRLMKQARAQFDGDEDIEAILLDIQSGTGTRDDVEDVLRLLALFFERWDEVGHRLPWTRAELELIEVDMTSLLKALRPKPIGEQALVILRQQAFTRFERAFNEVLDACRYLARHHPEVLAELKGLTA